MATAPKDLGLDTRAVSQLAGVNMATLDYWVRTGLVEPSIRGSSGRRVSRMWSVRDAVVVRTVKALRDAGCSLQTVRRAKQLLEERWRESVSEAVLLWDGRSDLIKMTRWGTVESLLKSPGQQLLHLVAIPLPHWRRE